MMKDYYVSASAEQEEKERGEKSDRKLACREANARSPQNLWERWGFFCEPVSVNEMRIYGKKEGVKSGPCLYRSFFNCGEGIWHHMKRDPLDGIIIDEIPGNESNWRRLKKDENGNPVFDKDGRQELERVKTNIDLATAFERAYMLRRCREAKERIEALRKLLNDREGLIGLLPEKDADEKTLENAIRKKKRELGEKKLAQEGIFNHTKKYESFQYMDAARLILEKCDSVDDYRMRFRSCAKAGTVRQGTTAAGKLSVRRIMLHFCSQPKDRELCLSYLKKRHISPQTAELFEKAHVLYYYGGTRDYSPGLLFAGWKRIDSVNGIKLPLPSYEPSCIAKRAVFDDKSGLHGNETSLKQFLGQADVGYIPFFRGENRDLAVIVEGGVDMLSIAEIARRFNLPVPTIAMRGGCSNLSMWQNENLLEILREAKKIIFVIDKDLHLSEKERENMRERLGKNMAEALKITANVAFVYPGGDEKCNDANDMLKDEYAGQLAEFATELFAGGQIFAQNNEFYCY